MIKLDLTVGNFFVSDDEGILLSISPCILLKKEHDEKKNEIIELLAESVAPKLHIISGTRDEFVKKNIDKVPKSLLEQSTKIPESYSTAIIITYATNNYPCGLDVLAKISRVINITNLDSLVQKINDRQDVLIVCNQEGELKIGPHHRLSELNLVQDLLHNQSRSS